MKGYEAEKLKVGKPNDENWVFDTENIIDLYYLNCSCLPGSY